jgi:hypothetical protein
MSIPGIAIYTVYCIELLVVIISPCPLAIVVVVATILSPSPVPAI